MVNCCGVAVIMKGEYKAHESRIETNRVPRGMTSEVICAEAIAMAI
jgi:hypothetical protein